MRVGAAEAERTDPGMTEAARHGLGRSFQIMQLADSHALELAQDTRYRSIFESAAIGLCEIDLSVALAMLQQHSDPHAWIDSDEGLAALAGVARVVAVNDMGARISGVSRAEWLRSPVKAIIEGGLAGSARQVLHALISGTAHFQAETVLETRDGRRVVSEIRHVDHYDPDTAQVVTDVWFGAGPDGVATPNPTSPIPVRLLDELVAHGYDPSLHERGAW